MSKYSKRKIRKAKNLRHLLRGMIIFAVLGLIIVLITSFIIQGKYYFSHPISIAIIVCIVAYYCYYATSQIRQAWELEEILKTEIRCHLLGEQGELEAFQRISKLKPEFAVIQNLQTEYGDIDFVVIGHNGITAIEVKNYSNRKSINFKLVKDRNQALRNAINLNKILSNSLNEDLLVTPLLVFTGNCRDYNPEQSKPTGEKTLAVGCIYINNAILNKNGMYLSQDKINKIQNFLTLTETD